MASEYPGHGGQIFWYMIATYVLCVKALALVVLVVGCASERFETHESARYHVDLSLANGYEQTGFKSSVLRFRIVPWASYGAQRVLIAVLIWHWSRQPVDLQSKC
jgi:hypothetical protein